jgi:hypothetical protein
MPAGSPEVTAIAGAAEGLALFDAVFDIGAVAHLPDPVLVGLVGLALAQHLRAASRWRSAVTSSVRRSSTWIRWKPKGDCTGSLIWLI